MRNAFGPLLLAIGGLAVWSQLAAVADKIVLTGVAGLLVAAATAIAVAGWRGPLAILGAIGGRELSPIEVRALQTTAHAVLCTGIAAGLVGVLMVMVLLGMPDEERSPAVLARLVQWALVAPAMGLMLGRVWLGALVDRVAEGELADDGLVLGALVVAVMAIFAVAIPV